jgi:formylglycine-generating enzyme required for sulfatase activity
LGAHCNDDNLVWEGWTTIETCSTDALCRVDGDGQSACETCVGGCNAGSCNCEDQDGDGYHAGASCPSALIDDCDDNAPGVTGACQANGCPQGWVLIDAGDFEMGCNDGEISPCEVDERPRRTITLSAYCIQPTEVSVAAYRACYSAPSTGCTSPGTTSVTPKCNFDTPPAGLENHPVNCVTWTEARAYCQEWVGGDLPSEAQWEKAARGDDQRLYPWGSDTPDCTRCNYDYSGADAPYGCGDVPEDTGPGTWEVGHISGTAGDSPYGLKDMAGNLWEYVLDCYDDTGYPACGPPCTDPVNTTCTNANWVVIRGSGWTQAGDQALRTFNRYYRESKTTWASIDGFRCVRTP